MSFDKRDFDIPPSGQVQVLRKRPGDKFTHNVNLNNMLGPEGWLNGANLVQPTGKGVVNLVAVDEVTSDSLVIAVGNYYDASGVSRTLIEKSTDHGTTWTAVTSPNHTKTVGGNQVAADNFLTGISHVSATEIYACGYFINENGVAQPIVMKSVDGAGATWTMCATFPVAGGATNGVYLTGIAAGLASSVVVCGYAYGDGNGGTSTSVRYAVISRTADGGTTWTTTWNNANLPAAAGSRDNVLLAIGKSSGTAFVAVGYYVASANGVEQTYCVRSTDTAVTWAIQTTPNGTYPSSEAGNNRLTGLAVKATEGTLVGYKPNPAGHSPAYVPFVMKDSTFTGTYTEITGFPLQGTGNNKLMGAFYGTKNAHNAFFVVGNYINASGGQKAMAAYYDSTAASWTMLALTDPATGCEALNAVCFGSVTGTPNNYYIHMVGASAGVALIEYNTYDSNTNSDNCTQQTGDGSIAGGITPPVLTLATITESNKAQQTALTWSGGTSGNVFIYDVIYNLSFPRGTTNLVANGYLRRLRLQLEVI